ncbi:amidase [Paenarthrobacter nitroguajacolicus]|uniref:amidase n=1 Tax=Paenarthrobacter nitroguajacolicus TaxID=211146 RepID=UPI0034456B46
MTDELHYLTATEALLRFREGTLSPVDLLTSIIDRAQSIEPTVNALCYTYFEAALEQAQEAADRWKRGGEEARPLEGIPVAVKADAEIAGQPFTMGSVPMKGVIAESTSIMVSRLIDAGAIVHARTAIPEFAGAAITKTRLWGETVNPWNPKYAVGGSSGGSAAALAAGTATLATGSDIAGSIRMPASMCGIVGYKPARGTVPADPPLNLDTYMHMGSMARTVDDIKLMQGVIAGPDWSDLVSLFPRPEETPLPVSGLRVAVCKDLGDWPVAAEVRRAVDSSAQTLREAGAYVEEVDLILPMQKVLRAASLHFSTSLDEFDKYYNEFGEQLTPSLIANVAGHRRRANGGSFSEMQALEAELWLAAKAVFEEFDVLLCPTMGTSDILAGLDYAGEDYVEVGGQKYSDLLEVSLTTPFNLFSACPVLSVPAGQSPNGVPLGVQLAGRPYQESAIFAAASALEDKAKWYASESFRPGSLG